MNALVTPPSPTANQPLPGQHVSGKRILIVGGFRIFPCNTGGHMRTGNIARALARMGHQVTIYALAGRQDDYRQANRPGFMRETIEPGLTEYTHLGLGYGVMQAIGRRLGLPRVWQYALVRCGWVPRSLKQHIAAADIVLSDLPWCPIVGDAVRHRPWYLISHNLEYRLLEQGNRWDRLAARWMKRVETAAPARYTDILACAEEDHAYFRQQSSANAKQLPIVRNGVDPNSYIAPPGLRERTRAELGVTDQDHLVIFSGSNFGPNLDALTWLRDFCQRHNEFLKQQRIVIVVIGSMSKPFRQGQLFASGRVPEMLPYFAAADAGLNPITRGSGANVKLFEYLAAQLPVISTAFGVRGTTLKPDQDYLAFDGDTLQQALHRLVHDRTRAAWRQQTNDVWQRQKSSCDIEDIMRATAIQLKDFAIQ